MTVSNTIDEATAIPVEVVETAKAVAELLTAKAEEIVTQKAAAKETRNLRAKQKRESEKASERASNVAALEGACEEAGFKLTDDILLDDYGMPVGSYENCWKLLGMNADVWRAGYDMLNYTYVFRGNISWKEHYGRAVSPDLIRGIRNWLLSTFGVDFQKNHIEDALLSICRARPFNPVVEYLDSLKHDGIERLDTWLTDYLGVPNNPYSRAVGKLWMLGAVGRARNPGVKFDTMLILEGKQGTDKSGAFDVLGGDFYSDAELGDLKNKDSVIQLEGVWIQELPELGTLRRSDVNDLKAFFSRRYDKFRAPFDRNSARHPRRCVFGGTGNVGKDRGYLVDETGNRRYWPVETGVTDIAKLRRDRDQLWAEAVAIYGDGSECSLVLPKELWSVAGEEQKARLLIDPWVEEIKPWLDDPFHEREAEKVDYDGRKYGDVIGPYLVDGKLTKIHSRIIMSACLGIPKGSQTKEHGRRLRSAMSSIGGWDYNENLTAGGLKGIGGYELTGVQG